jgi:hypothetical protein
MTERSSPKLPQRRSLKYARKRPTRHGLLKKIHRRIAWDVVLATQIIEGADQTAPTVAVMIAGVSSARRLQKNSSKRSSI